MKVAVLIDTWFPFVGGGQINAYEISKNLAKKGVIIDVITRNCGHDNLQKIKNINFIKLGKKSNPKSLLSKIFFIFSSFLYLYKRNYDIVHAHAFLPGITARLISVFATTPSVLTVHGTSIGTNLNSRFSNLIEKFILTRIRYNAQITVSRDFSNLKNINKNISYIPNAVDINFFDKILASKQSFPTIIFVGRLHPQKNVTTLIKAIGQLKKTLPEIRLVIVGIGQQMLLIKKEIKYRHLSKNVRITGEVRGKNLVKLYKSSHLFVLPSIYEGQPLALLEAWASRIPVITTKTGDSQYLVKNGVNGYLISNAFDFKEMAHGIEKTITDKKSNKMGENGYNFVKRNYSWDKSSALTLKVYEGITKTAY